MSIIKIPDNLYISITNDEELAHAEALYDAYFNGDQPMDNEDQRMEIIEKIAILLDLYQGSSRLTYNYMGSLISKE
jgi:hypothetical protein